MPSAVKAVSVFDSLINLIANQSITKRVCIAHKHCVSSDSMTLLFYSQSKL